MNKSITVLAQPAGVWTFVDVIWTAPLRLIFTAKNSTWKYSATDECGADGDLLSALDPTRTILGAGPVGALIGKIGGSTAGVKDGAATFLVGRYLALETKPEWKGALYLTINDEPKGMSNNSGQIDVDISIDT